MSIDSENAGRRDGREFASRGSGFLGGQPVRLADGEDWFFPGPHEVKSAGHPIVTEVCDLLDAIASAEDTPERLRGELALAIRLLSLNYRLTPDDYGRLLSTSDESALAQIQFAFRSLTCILAKNLWPNHEPTAASKATAPRAPHIAPVEPKRPLP